jgi:hypothetical protein
MTKQAKGTELELAKLEFCIIKSSHGYYWQHLESNQEGDNIWETKKEAMIECIDDNELDICYPD